MPFVQQALVVRHREVGHRYYELEFIAPEIAREVQPGQFVHIKVGGSEDPLLRRPFSIYNVEKKLGSITLFYKVVGRGTRLLTHVHLESRLDVMGPLGRPFSIPAGIRSALLVGGGVGIAPLVYLARVLVETHVAVKVLLGASTANLLAGRDQLERMDINFAVCTDDGSEGARGMVTDLCHHELERADYDFIYACGPEAMMARITHIAEERGIPGELSLEEHMACGVGACLGCAHRVKGLDGERYAKVCSEGPVFAIGEVLFEEPQMR